MQPLLTTFPPDQLISTFIELLKISSTINSFDTPTLTACHRVLQREFSDKPSELKDSRVIFESAVRAFHRDQKDGRDIATPMYEKNRILLSRIWISNTLSPIHLDRWAKRHRKELRRPAARTPGPYVRCLCQSG